MIELPSRLIILLFLCLVFAGCSKKSDVDEAHGTVSVQIPAQENADTYRMVTVDLIEISNLKEVAGKFARFFYSPGASDSQLIGGAPRAKFVKSGSVFIPTDFVSAQMATIYFHMQNLAALDRQIGAEKVNSWPRSVGLETLMVENGVQRKNSAFYDGITDAMMFAPFTATDLPISVNAGIIAHEHFHSLFFKLVIKTALVNNKITTGIISAHETNFELEIKRKMTVPRITSEKKKAQLFNEVYLRGLNEGLADFWGWIYTDDPNFMKWSLPDYIKARTLSLAAAETGEYQTHETIERNVDRAISMSDEPRLALIDDAYTIGTPHARFLKQWTALRMESEKLTASEAKKLVATDIISHLEALAQKIKILEDGEMLNAADLFENFIAKQIERKNLSEAACDFAVEYLNFEKNNDVRIKCVKSDGNNVVVKP